jgi:adenosylmethionine-8-amino-7-oxononanoate aminotransferase
MFFVYSANIVAMFTFHISHVITKSRGSSIKEVVHGISFINHPAICDVGNTSQKPRKPLL